MQYMCLIIQYHVASYILVPKRRLIHAMASWSILNLAHWKLSLQYVYYRGDRLFIDI